MKTLKNENTLYKLFIIKVDPNNVKNGFTEKAISVKKTPQSGSYKSTEERIYITKDKINNYKLFNGNMFFVGEFDRNKMRKLAIEEANKRREHLVKMGKNMIKNYSSPIPY